MGTQAVLDLLITARYAGKPALDALSADIDRIQSHVSRLQKVGDSMQAIGTGMLVAGAALAAGLAYSIDQAAKFDAQITHLNQTLQGTPAQIKAISDQILKSAPTFGINPTDAANAAYSVASGANLKAPQFLAANPMPAIMEYFRTQYSPGGVLPSSDFPAFALQTTQNLQALQAPANTWAATLDTLLEVEQHSNVSTEQLNQYVSKMGRIRSLGMSPTDILLEGGALGSLGIHGSLAGTELSSGIQHMLGAGQKELTKLGISPQSLFDKSGNLLPMSQLLTRFNQATAGMSPAERFNALTGVFGTVGAKAMIPLASQPGMAAQAALTQVTAGSAAEKQADLASKAYQMTHTVQGLWEAILQRVRAIAIVIGEDIKPDVLKWETAILNLLTKLQAFLQAHPNIAGDALKAVPALLGGGAALKGGGMLLSFLGTATGREKGEIVRTIGSDLAGHMNRGVAGLFGAGSGAGNAVKGMGLGLADHIGAFGRHVNALGHAEAMGKTYDPFGVLSHGSARFMDRHFPNALAMHAMEAGAKDLGQFDAHPNMAFLGGMGKDLGGGLGGILEKLSGGIGGLVSKIPLLLGMLPGLVGGFLAIAGPVLLVAGAIAIGVLAFTRYHDQTMKAIDAIGKQLAPIFQFFGAIVQTVWGQIQAAWQAAQPAIDKAMQALLTNLPKIAPLFEVVGAVIGAVVAVIAGLLIGLVNGFLSALAPIINFFSGLISFIGGFFNILVGIFTLNGDRIKQGWSDMWSGLWQMLTSAAQAIWNFIVGFVQGIGNFFAGLWDTLQGKGKKGGQDTGKAVSQGLTSSIPGIHTAATSAASAATDPFSTMSNTVYNDTTDAMNTMVFTMDAYHNKLVLIANGMVAAIDAEFAKLGPAANAAANATKLGFERHMVEMAADVVHHSIIPDMVTAILSWFNFMHDHGTSKVQRMVDTIRGTLQTLAQPNLALGIPGFASGTLDAPGGLAWVGERGAELVRLPQHSQVYPNGTGPQGAQPHSTGSLDFYALAASIRREREYRVTGNLPVTGDQFMNNLDLAYRFGYQKTA